VLQKIKILHIIKSLGRGGAEMLLPETLRLHDQTKFEFHCIYFLPWKNQLVEVIRKEGGVVTCLAAKNNLGILLNVHAVIRYVRQHDIRLIHCHLPWAGLAGRLVHRFTGLPVIYTEHNKQERYHLLTRWMNRLTFNWQSVAIAVSADVASSIQKNINPKIAVRQIANGVDAGFFQRDETAGQLLRSRLGIRTDAIVVGTVAVFRFQKRLKEWLDVFQKASQSNSNLVGVIVGDGPLKEDLFQHRKNLGMEHKVIMPGLQTEVKPWYSVMDIFMMTSEFEGLPVALLEAMSMECAIATTDAGGIKQVVRPQVEGAVVEVGRWKELSDEIINLSMEPERRKQLGEAARKRVTEDFSLKQMVGTLEDLYNNVLM
jgi:L-malate glycosyltransferase